MFATDTNPEVRRLGRLALRRDMRDPSDFFVLGDLCAELSHYNGRLLVVYVGKTLSAYQEAEKIARQDAEVLGLPEEPNDVLLARTAIERYVIWLTKIAKIVQTPRNIAVALWAVTEIP
ncbi:MAG: hypothetical protein L0Y58_19095, partial [Verrucomicrobia subdivision 3 bacterium]|nr:hypothetical protein [Limisphaerales bacterium]